MENLTPPAATAGLRPMQGKNTLITGSTGGIGRGIAEKFASLGSNIVLNGFGEPSEIEALRSSLEKKYNVTAHFIDADLANVTQIETMVRRAHELLGGIDILINNAGNQFVSPIEDFPLDKYNSIIAITMSAAFHTTRLIVPSMKSKKWGRIINIASAHALVASAYKSAYVMAKHGVAGLTKTVALEVAQQGITVNAICPGYVWTPLVEKQIPDTAKARNITEQEVIDKILLAAMPTKKFVSIEQVASFAAFLASDDAASITGAIQTIDGGWTAQ